MRLHRLTPAVLLLVTPPLLAAGQRTIEVRVPGPAGSLAGTLTLPPQGPGPFRAVLTLTGSGAHHRDGNRTPTHPYRPFQQIAERLAACGIATLRLDDRGVGGSEGDASAATLEDTAADAHAALRFLRGRPEIDPARLMLIGHSYGGVVAPLVAAEDTRLAAVVLMGAPARPFRETMRYQHRYRIWSDPAVPAERREGALADAMRQQAANVAASNEAWRRSIQDRDPLPTARRLRLPVLILQGTTDRAVDLEDARLLEREIRGAGNPRITVRVFRDVNHHFQHDPVGAREGYDRLPSQDLAPEVLETLCAWLGAAVLNVRRITGTSSGPAGRQYRSTPLPSPPEGLCLPRTCTVLVEHVGAGAGAGAPGEVLEDPNAAVGPARDLADGAPSVDLAGLDLRVAKHEPRARESADQVPPRHGPATVSPQDPRAPLTEMEPGVGANHALLSRRAHVHHEAIEVHPVILPWARVVIPRQGSSRLVPAAASRSTSARRPASRGTL